MDELAAMDELSAIEAWLDDQDAPHIGDLNAEPTPVSILGQICWLIEQASISTQQSPSEPAPYLRPEVLAFAHLMEAQLKANDHKPGWKNDRPDYLLTRLYDEAEEVRDNLDFWRNSYPHRASLSSEIGKETADVANFAMMIADICGALRSVNPSKPAPLKMLVDADWLGEKVASDPELDCEAGPGPLYHGLIDPRTRKPRELPMPAPAVQEQGDAYELRKALRDLVMLKAQAEIGCVPLSTKEQWVKAWGIAEELAMVEP